jgi:hypothetical protein
MFCGMQAELVNKILVVICPWESYKHACLESNNITVKIITILYLVQFLRSQYENSLIFRLFSWMLRR